MILFTFTITALFLALFSIRYGFWRMIAIVLANCAALFAAMSEWARMMHELTGHASEEFGKTFRNYRKEAMKAICE